MFYGITFRPERQRWPLQLFSAWEQSLWRGEARHPKPNLRSRLLSAESVSDLSSSPASQRPNTVLVEIGGYAARALARDMTDSLPPYIAQYLSILVAPALFAASIYMILGRVTRGTNGERHSLISPTRLTHIFVAGDVISFFIQITGDSLQSIKKFNRTAANESFLWV